MNSPSPLPYSLGGPLPKRIYIPLSARWHALGARIMKPEGSSFDDPFIHTQIEDLLAWTAEWGRSDFRLLEILLDWLWRNWQNVHPSKLNRVILTMQSPAVWGVLFEWTRLRRNEMSKAQAAFWIIVLENIKAGPQAPLFYEGKKLKLTDIRAKILLTPSFYKKWNFIETNLPSIGRWKSMGFQPTKKDRLHHLRLLAETEPLTLEKYRRHFGYQVSRQTAARDFSSAKFLKKIGHTKGSRYVLKKRFKSLSYRVFQEH